MATPNPPFLTVDPGSGLPYLGAGTLGGTPFAPAGQTLTPTAGFPGAAGLGNFTSTVFGYTVSQSGSFSIATPPAGLNAATLTLPLARIGAPSFTLASQASGSFVMKGAAGGGPVYGTVAAVPGTATVLLSATVPAGLTLAAPSMVTFGMTYSIWPV